ncbi:rod-binding protein [Sphingomonas sp.]|uniref:rod-binding protein n=1 Tax=Sphingomonas sp. TaxID=28214 RepID=UPI0037515140
MTIAPPRPGVQPPGAVPAPNPHAAAEKTARDFEAVFTGQMAKLMLESVDVDSEFGGGHGEEMFRGILTEQLGPAIAGRAGLGIAPAVLQQILRLQGEQP